MKIKMCTLVIFTVVLALLVPGCDNLIDLFTGGSDGDAEYFVTSNGTEGIDESTDLIFTFTKNIDRLNLSMNDITIIPIGDGLAEKGNLFTSIGNVYRMSINTVWPGYILVSINKPGIESVVKTVMVYRAPIGYTVNIDGTADTVDTTKITFIFDEDFSLSTADLFASDIIIEDITGSVVRRNLVKTDSRHYDVGITVNWRGNIRITVLKQGISAAPITRTVHRVLPPTTYYIIADGSFNQENTTKLVFTFNNFVSDGLLVSNQIRITNKSGTVSAGTLRNINNQVWELPVDNVIQGDIEVRIIDSPIDDSPKIVYVYRIP